jgi:hypothetical protein
MWAKVFWGWELTIKLEDPPALSHRKQQSQARAWESASGFEDKKTRHKSHPSQNRNGKHLRAESIRSLQLLYTFAAACKTCRIWGHVIS